MIIGRKKEIELLNNVLSSSHSNFIAVYGRRRVGKTYLIKTYFNEIAEEVDFFYYSGSPNLSSKKEIGRMNKILIEKGIKGTCSSWMDIFQKLQKFIVTSNKQKVVVFLDEVPWLDKKQSDFLNELSQFWDGFVSTEQNVILIISGSSGSWMSKMVLNNTKQLYNRVIEKVQIKPFTLKETAEYMKKIKGKDLDLEDLFSIYIHYGGIPYYLNQYKKLNTLEQNLSKLDNRFYDDEYSTLVESIFGSKKGHHDVLLKLVNRKGKDLSELVEGDYNKKTYESAINDLVYSDFILKVKSYRDRKQDTFVLVDEFFTNYFNREHSPSSLGLRFEKIVLKHVDKICTIVNENKDNLDIYFDARIGRSQIDLLLIGERTAYIFEIKHYSGKYSIDGSYYEKLLERKEVVREWISRMRYNKKEIKTGFITMKGLTNNSFAREQVSISLEDFLD